MSTLAQLLRARAGIRSVQTGVVSVTSLTGGTFATEDYRYTNVTISSVTTSRCAVFFEGGASAATNRECSRAHSTDYAAGCTARLTSATQLRIAAIGPYDTTPSRIVGRWTVVEYE